MPTKVPFQAPDYHTVTPAIAIKGAAEAIEFYKRAFNARELHRMASPDGTVMHAEIQIGDARIMVSDEFPDWGVLSAKTIGGSPTTLYIYCEDVDATTKQAIAAGVIPGPRLLIATLGIVATGSYGPKFSTEVDVPQGAQEASGLDEVIRVTRAQIGKGADIVKVYADYRWGKDEPSRPTFSQEELTAIVQTARGMGIKTIAEFVGDAATQQLLESYGVDYAQGYHVGHPVDVDLLWPPALRAQPEPG